MTRTKQYSPITTRYIPNRIVNHNMWLTGLVFIGSDYLAQVHRRGCISWRWKARLLFYFDGTAPGLSLFRNETSLFDHQQKFLINKISSNEPRFKIFQIKGLKKKKRRQVLRRGVLARTPESTPDVSSRPRHPKALRSQTPPPEGFAIWSIC